MSLTDTLLVTVLNVWFGYFSEEPKRRYKSDHLLPKYRDTLLLASVYSISSYVMQRLAALTRADIDNAHREGASVNVGSLAVTNFALLSEKKFAVFALLWSGSFPLHLMFNSTIIYTSPNAEWSNYAIIVSEDQLEIVRANTSHAIPPRNYPGFSKDIWSGLP